MAKVLGQSLWDFCEELIKKGAGYVWGGCGNVYDEKEAERLYKTYGNGNYNEKYYMVTSMQRWKGKIVVDCSGMIEAFRRAKFDGKDNTANSLYYDECPESNRGTLDTLPKDLRGVLLFRANGSRMSHVGVYGGDNTTIESYGSSVGVVKKDPINKSSWTHWGIPSWLEPTKITKKSETVKTTQAAKPVTSKPVAKSAKPLMVCKVTGCSKLHVRKGPGILNSSIGTVKRGDIVNVYFIKGNWGRIDEKADMWCSIKYLAALPKYEIVNCTSLNVRKGPAVTNKVVNYLHAGDIVWKYGEEYGWYKIGPNQYVSKKYLKALG